MSKMKTSVQAYFIECVTNMHAGSGDANYGVVDKLVQRDPVTCFPTIHASSLKGALREHFESIWGKGTKVDTVFGKEDSKNPATGEYSFLGADLLSLPVRSNFEQFALTFCPCVFNIVNSRTKLLQKKDLLKEDLPINTLFVKKKLPQYEVFLEDDMVEKVPFQSLLNCHSVPFFENNFAIVDDSRFESYAKDLPVLARNHLTCGKSDNLWYEEIVPHKTVFVTYVFTTDNLFDEFEKILLAETVQIGANASIGYGICKFHKIIWS